MSGGSAGTFRVGIGTPLASELIQRIEGSAGVTVVAPADLLGQQRWIADHAGQRSPQAQEQLVEALRSCEVVLGIPGDSPAGLAALLAEGSAVRWVHGTAAGAGEQTRRAQLPQQILDSVRVTTSAGVHAAPLAEFAIFGLLAFHKDLDRLLDMRVEHTWPSRWPMTQLQGRRLLVLGLGSIGRAVAASASALGMQVTGIRRSAEQAPPPGVSSVRSFTDLLDAAAEADDLVVTLPGTAETEGLVGADMFAAMPPGAVLVNVGRGSCIDESALYDALLSKHLRGAVLEVAAVEPRSPADQLWSLPNLLQSPHTAALSAREDDLIVDLFLENLAAFKDGTALRNVVDPVLFY